MVRSCVTPGAIRSGVFPLPKSTPCMPPQMLHKVTPQLVQKHKEFVLLVVDESMSVRELTRMIWMVMVVVDDFATVGQEE